MKSIFNPGICHIMPPGLLSFFQISPKLNCQTSQNSRLAGDSGCLKSAKSLSENMCLTCVTLTLWSTKLKGLMQHCRKHLSSAGLRVVRTHMFITQDESGSNHAINVLDKSWKAKCIWLKTPQHLPPPPALS